MKNTTTAAEREEKTYKKPNIHIWIPYSTAVCTWITLLASTSHISIQQSTEQSPEKKTKLYLSLNSRCFARKY